MSALGDPTQLFIVSLLPYFYPFLIVLFISAVKTGFEWRDFSLFIAIPLVLLTQLSPLSTQELPYIMLSCLVSTFALGLVIGYLPRCFGKNFLGIY